MSEPLIRLLHAAYSAPADGASDGDLLARIVASKDDEAFELLLRRHAALVWRVCRSVTRDHHAAEDAFQATFLALATKAKTVRGSVAGWLYRVAYHAAIKAKASRVLPSQMIECETPEPADAERAALLHAELNAMPDRYRVPVVLCHLHGFTQADAAKQLGLPVGTIATRVRRGLDRLREHLVRRGVAVPSTIASLFAADAVAVSPKLITLVGRVGATPPAELTRLAEGAVAAMTPFHWKPAAALMTIAPAVAAGAFVSANHTPIQAEKPDAKAAEKPPAVLVPASHWQSQKSRDNLHRVALGIHSYVDEHNDFPKDIKDKEGRPGLSWRVAILPYMDLEFLHAQFKLDEPWDGPNNRKLLAFMPGAFRAPVQAPKATDTFVQAVVGLGAVFDPKAKVGFLDITDGTSQTLMLAETGPAVPWTKPADVAFDPEGKLPTFAGPYADAIHIATADSATYRMTTRPDAEELRKYILRGDGTAIQTEDLKAPPAKPVTEEDKKLLADRRAYAMKRLRQAIGDAEDRFKCEQELRKLGDPPQLDPSKVETLEELERMLQDIDERMRADSHEYYRLIEHVQKAAPRAAARIELTRQERFQKEAKDR